MRVHTPHTCKHARNLRIKIDEYVKSVINKAFTIIFISYILLHITTTKVQNIAGLDII